jgi:putative heme iron utilization protein
MSQTLELVTFKLARGDASTFVAANTAITDWLTRQPGFISRRLAERADGSFVDAVIWANAQDAQVAADRMPAEIGGTEAMQMIDPASIDMSHGAVRVARG